MNVGEIQKREDFAGILSSTLQSGWSCQLGRDVEVRTSPQAGAQPWRLQRLLSVLYAWPVGQPVRRFSADLFRYSPVRARALPQWVLGTLLASRAGLRWVGVPMLWVSPPVPRSRDLLVFPGNARVRVFDFDTGTCRVMLKAGFSSTANLVEVSVRGPGKHGPFLNVASFDPLGSWFEEPIVDGYPLPRCPRQAERLRYERRAFERLAAWLAASSRSADPGGYVARLVVAIQEGAVRLAAAASVPDLLDVAGRLAEVAGRPRTVLLARAHGDFQAGNILVDRTSQEVYLTDWEYSGVRHASYDWLVYGLRARAGPGLAERVRRFVDRGELDSCAPYAGLGSRNDRASAAASFLLEELRWRIEQALTWPIPHLSESARVLVREASSVLLDLAPRP